MRFIPIVSSFACAILFVLVMVGCGGNKQQKQAGKNYSHEQASQQAALAEQLRVTPVEYPKFSDERSNINERNIRLNDPNKITYVYLLSRAGTVVMHDVAKGKVSSCSSQILPEEGPIRYRGADVVVPQPEPDGSFSTNGDCIFYFTPQGAYREWLGDYLMSDQPITVTNPVNLVVTAKAKISASTHAKTGNDGAPYGKTK